MNLKRLLPIWLQRIGLVVGALVAYYFIGNYLQHGSQPDLPPIYEEARCQRALLDQGLSTAELAESCRLD